MDYLEVVIRGTSYRPRRMTGSLLLLAKQFSGLVFVASDPMSCTGSVARTFSHYVNKETVPLPERFYDFHPGKCHHIER